jgi:TetR/AcrR family transcriptional repressor of nem operon
MPWKKSYNEAEVLDRAMQAFWVHGYEATSMSDLVSATGINRGSIYAAFSDKRTLFIRALRHYDKHHRMDFLTGIEKRHPPVEAIAAAFENVIGGALKNEAAGRKGCLLVNTALELSPHDPEIDAIVRDSLTELELFFRTMIERGQAEGSIRRGLDPAATAQALLSLFLGLRVLTRSRPEKALLETIGEQARTMLQ